MKRIDIATPEEALEAEVAIISAAGLKIQRSFFQKDGVGSGFFVHDLALPVKGYVHDQSGAPVTLTLDSMRAKGLLK